MGIYGLMYVYRYLQPFMVCMSPSQSTKIIEELTDGHDADVLYWRDEVAKVSEL